MSPATVTSVSIQFTLGPLAKASLMGGNLLPGQGATFVLRAPLAREVSLPRGCAKSPGGVWEPDSRHEMPPIKYKS